MFRLLATALLAVSSTSVSAAPFDTASTLDGSAFNPSGHVTVVNFWATWCVPCRIEMPVLDSFYSRHHGQGLQMLAISIDDSAPTAKLRQVTGKFAFPVARMEQVEMPRRDIPRSIPVTRVYDKSGELIFQSRGDGRTVIDAATLERIVTPLLNH